MNTALSYYMLNEVFSSEVTRSELDVSGRPTPVRRSRSIPLAAALAVVPIVVAGIVGIA